MKGGEVIEGELAEVRGGKLGEVRWNVRENEGMWGERVVYEEKVRNEEELRGKVEKVSGGEIRRRGELERCRGSKNGKKYGRLGLKQLNLQAIGSLNHILV